MYDYFMEKVSDDFIIEAREAGLEEEARAKDAIEKVITDPYQRFLIIEGAAGSGKTEYIRHIRKKYDTFFSGGGRRIAYAAPSRQAASNLRLRNISFALTTQKYMSDFKNYDKDPNDIKLFIIDEASLLTFEEVKELYKLCKRNQELKYIFLGDSGQNYPYCFKNRKEEKKFTALEEDEIVKIFNFKSMQGQKIQIETPWRFIDETSPRSKTFLKLLNDLREDSFKGGLGDLPECEEIKFFEEENLISNLINVNSSGLSRNIKTIIDSKVSKDEKIEESLQLIKSQYYWEKNEKRSFNEFKDEEIKKAIESRFDLSQSRPLMGDIYNQKFKMNKNKSSDVIALFRRNVHVQQANLDLRQHLEHVKKVDFDKFTKDLNIDSSYKDFLPVKGDLLFVAGNDTDKQHSSVGSEGKYQQAFYPGDLLIANSDIRKSDELREITDPILNEENYFFEIDLKPLIYLPDTRKDQLVQYLVRQNRKCIVWLGGFIIDRSKEDPYRIFRQQIEKIRDKTKTTGRRYEDDDIYLERALIQCGMSRENYDKLSGYRRRFDYNSHPNNPNKGRGRYAWYYFPPGSGVSTEEPKFRKPKFNGYTLEEVNDIANDLYRDKKSDSYFINEICDNSILIDFAYSLTHKTAQGGEWNNVIIESADVWEDDEKNRFLYTALSRSRGDIHLSYIK